MKIRVVLSISVFLVLAICGVSGGGEVKISLPDIEGWECGAQQTVELETVSGNQGFWVRRNYLSDGGTPLTVNLMGGKGPKMLHIPPEGVDSSDGLIGSGASYETIHVAERRAVLEHDPVIGYSLAAVLDGGVITIESNRYGLGKTDFIHDAERFLENLLQ